MSRFSLSQRQILNSDSWLILFGSNSLHLIFEGDLHPAIVQSPQKIQVL